MNGLKYIRTRCNLSLSDLAEILGVTRQAISSWESGKKEIPEKRQQQLAQFFGVEKAYFGEISEEEKKICWKKQCFGVLRKAKKHTGTSPGKIWMRRKM